MDKLSTYLQNCPAARPGKQQIELLLKAKPYLQHYFDASLEDTIEDSIQIIASKNNLPVVVVQKDNGSHAMASKYDPLKQAQGLVSDQLKNTSPTTIILISGLGNPLCIPLVLERLRPNQICIVLEADFHYVSWLCNHWPDFSKFLERPGCHLFAGDQMADYLERYLDSLPTERLSGVRILQDRSSHSLHPEFYSYHEKRIQDILQTQMSDLLTRFQFEPLWIRNIISNTRYLGGKDSPKKQLEFGAENLLSYANALDGVPAVLVSAGPSLRKSLPYLADLKKKAFLLACDTALKPMLKAGIIPDAVFILDAQKHTLFHFLGESDLSKIIVFTDVVINPVVLRNLKPRCVIFSTTARSVQDASGKEKRQITPGTQFLEHIHGPLGSLQSGGSVATSAFDLLRFLGCSSIILMGQDLAYTWRQLHSCGVHHYERWNAKTNRLYSLETINEGIIKKRSTYVSQGIRSPVLSDYVLDIYKNWFEDSFLAIDLPIYNMTHDGNTIENTQTVKDPKSFIEQLPLRPNVDPFSQAHPLIPHDHLVMQDLIRGLGEVLQSDDFILEWEKLCKDYPSLVYLNRRIKVYMKRNKEKLGPDRVQKLTNKQTKDLVHELYMKLLKGARPPSSHQ